MSKKTLLSIILISLFYSCSTPKENEADPQSEGMEKVDDKIVEVRARVLEYEDFNYELLSNGTIASMHWAALSFQSQEPITKIYVKNGQSVTKGQKLAELDDFKLKSSLDQATWQLELAKLDLQDVLIGQGYSLSDSAAIPAEVMKIAKIRSNYEQSYHNYKVAQYNLDASVLYAPFSGVIANLTVKEYNQPGNEPFCLVIDNRNPEVVFNILENELPLVQMNDKVLVTPFAQESYTVEGRITEINPLIDQHGMVQVKAVIPNTANRFLEGMNVSVRVQRLLGKRLVIPKSALVLRSNRKVVFTLENGKAIWVYVQTAQENSDSYVVTEGLNPGDSIIYEGNFNLSHESPVLLKP